MEKATEGFIDTYLKELRENNTAVFVGAGLSRAAGYVDWQGLMSSIAEGLGLDAGKETDLVAVAQYHLNANSAHRHQLSQLLIDQFSDLAEPTKNHWLLARLPVQTYWTTNYDRLIESALEAGGRRVDAKYTNEQLAITRRGRDAVVYKMHGDVEHPDKAVLSKDDYERYHKTHAPFITALSGDLVEKTFLFLGFSFTDPNLDFILSRIRSQFVNHQRQHYCLAKRRKRAPKEKKAEFEYAANKQNLVVQDLMRFNIKTILVDEFPEITELLQAIEQRYRRRSIFISGNAADYGSWGQSATEEFLSKFARALIEKGLRITSGFGLGIGAAVVTGAVQQIYSTSQRSIEEQLLLRPFPIGISDAQQRERTFKRYRDELIEQAGIGVFVMGNKTNTNGNLINSEGVRLEFESAKSKGLYLIPVGSSGSMAGELWKEVVGEIDEFFPKNTKTIRPLLEAIGHPVKNPNDLLDPLLKLIDLLAKE